MLHLGYNNPLTNVAGNQLIAVMRVGNGQLAKRLGLGLYFKGRQTEQKNKIKKIQMRTAWVRFTPLQPNGCMGASLWV